MEARNVGSYGPGHVRMTEAEIRLVVYLLQKERLGREAAEHHSDTIKDLLARAERNSDQSPNALDRYSEYMEKA